MNASEPHQELCREELDSLLRIFERSDEPEVVKEAFEHLPSGSLDIFLTVPDPDEWPETMQPLHKWIEENVPPEYWAEFEDE